VRSGSGVGREEGKTYSHQAIALLCDGIEGSAIGFGAVHDGVLVLVLEIYGWGASKSCARGWGGEWMADRRVLMTRGKTSASWVLLNGFVRAATRWIDTVTC
jgi:hypothetical protein